MSAGPVQAAVARAQASLDQARNELDTAMLSLATIDGETVLANAELVALLLRVVTARRYLEGLSGPVIASTPVVRH
jgi:outer membrane protein TolC